MENLNNNTVESRTSGAPMPKTILTLLKEARTKQLAKLSENVSNNDVDVTKQLESSSDDRSEQTDTKIRAKQHASTNKVELIRRSSMQEQLFLSNCKKSYSKPVENSSSDTLENHAQPQNYNKNRNKKYNLCGHPNAYRQNSQPPFHRSQYNNYSSANGSVDNSGKECNSMSQSHYNRRTERNIQNQNNKKSFYSNGQRHNLQPQYLRKQNETSNSLDSPNSYFNQQEERQKRESYNKSYDRSTENKYKKYSYSNTSRLRRKSEDESESANEENETETVCMAGVLHAKGPLINEKNLSIYYDSHGRMEPIDWSKATNEDKTSYGKKRPEASKKRREESHVIKTPEVLLEANPDFINFVKNTTKPETIYKVRGNVEQLTNGMDSPLLKLRRMMANNTKNTILHITPEIKETLKPVDSGMHLIDIIDLPVERSTSEQNKKPTSNQISEVTKMESITSSNQPQNDDKHKVHDPSTAKIMKKKILEEYDDDLFTFQKSKSKRSVSLSLSNSENIDESTISSSRSTSNASITFESITKYELPKTNTLINSSNSSSSNVTSDKKNSNSHPVFKKLKKLSLKQETANSSLEILNIKQENLNVSLDSDDIPLDKTNENEKVPISKMTTRTLMHLRKLKNLQNIPSQHSSIEIQNIHKSNVNQKECENQVESRSDEFLIKEKCTRYFNKSDNNTGAENNIEIHKVCSSHSEIKPIDEPLLTPVYTRYFKPNMSNTEKKRLDVKEIECKVNDETNIPPMELKEENKIEKQDTHSNIRNSEQICETAVTTVNKEKCTDFSSDSNLSVKNNSIDRVSDDTKKIDFENCFARLNLNNVIEKLPKELKEEKKVKEIQVTKPRLNNSEQMCKTEVSTVNKEKCTDFSSDSNSSIKNNSIDRVSDEMEKIDFENCFAKLNLNNVIEKLPKELNEKKKVEEIKVTKPSLNNSEQIHKTEVTIVNKEKCTDFSSDSNLSTKNNSIDKVSEETKKIDFENCFGGLNLQNIFNGVDKEKDTVEKMEKDIAIPVAIEKIDLMMDQKTDSLAITEVKESEEMPLLDLTNNNDEYDLDSDCDKYDIVNLQEFPMYEECMEKVEAAVYKFIAKNLKSVENIDTNSNDDSEIKSLTNIKSIENVTNVTCATDSSTLESDVGNENINGYTTKYRNQIIAKVVNGKNEVSGRQKKMMNALKNYQKSLELEDTEEKSEETVQQPNTLHNKRKAVQQLDARQNKSSRTAGQLGRHQILEKIKNARLHLDCKPLIKQSAIRL